MPMPLRSHSTRCASGTLSCSAQHRFAFARNGQAIASEAFQQALAMAGVQAETPATVLCDGDALDRLRRSLLRRRIARAMAVAAAA